MTARLVWLAIVAAAAYASGRRQGQVEGQLTGMGLAATAFTAGVKSR